MNFVFSPDEKVIVSWMCQLVFPLSPQRRKIVRPASAIRWIDGDLVEGRFQKLSCIADSTWCGCVSVSEKMERFPFQECANLPDFVFLLNPPTSAVYDCEWIHEDFIPFLTCDVNVHMMTSHSSHSVVHLVYSDPR